MRKKRIVRESLCIYVCAGVYTFVCSFVRSFVSCGFRFFFELQIRIPAKLGNNWIVRTKSDQQPSHSYRYMKKSRNGIRVRASILVLSHSLLHTDIKYTQSKWKCVFFSSCKTLTKTAEKKGTKYEDCVLYIQIHIYVCIHQTTTLMQKWSRRGACVWNLKCKQINDQIKRTT